MPDEEIGPSFRRVLSDNLAEMGWTPEQIEQGIGIAGRIILSAARLSKSWEAKHGEKAIGLLEDILRRSTTAKELHDTLNGYGLNRNFQHKEIVSYCRGMLFALGGQYDISSPLDDQPEPRPKPPKSATAYWLDWANKSNP